MSKYPVFDNCSFEYPSLYSCLFLISVQIMDYGYTLEPPHKAVLMSIQCLPDTRFISLPKPLVVDTH